MTFKEYIQANLNNIPLFSELVKFKEFVVNKYGNRDLLYRDIDFVTDYLNSFLSDNYYELKRAENSIKLVNTTAFNTFEDLASINTSNISGTSSNESTNIEKYKGFNVDSEYAGNEGNMSTTSNNTSNSRHTNKARDIHNYTFARATTYFTKLGKKMAIYLFRQLY